MAFRRLFSRSPTTTSTTTPTAPSFNDVFDDFFFGPGGLFPISHEWKTDPKLPIPPAISKHGSIPIPVDGPDAEPKREAKGQRRRATDPLAYTAKAAPAPASVTVAQRRRMPSAEAAAVRLQAAARGFVARRSVQAVREVERKAETVGYVVRHREEELRRNQTARVAAGEALMRMLLRLDAVRGAREYRRRVTRKVLALQDAVDALVEPKAPAPGEATTAEDEIAGAADASAGVEDTRELMEIVAALCERNAEQRALIVALAERVDALERTVRRMEDAGR